MSVESVVAEVTSVHRDLSAVDLIEVQAFAGQVVRLREAQARIASEGMIVADAKGVPEVHPALEIERQASVEIRGWVTKRPDLFGAAKDAGGADDGDILGGLRLA